MSEEMKMNDRPKMEWAEPGSLEGHPMNREFATRGEEWESFVESIGERGVLAPLVVRVLETGRRQIVAGHRRRAAAVAAGLEWVPVVVRRMDEREAAEVVLLENLEREDLSPIDEARSVRGLVEELGMTVEEVAARLRRGAEWVRTRQGLLELGDEVCEALRRPRDDRHRLTVGAAKELLRVPEEWRPEAVQLVLHPGFEDGALSEEQAREVLRRCLLEPKAAEQAWEAAREETLASWRERLRELCLPGTAEELLVKLGRHGEQVRGGTGAEERVPLAELLPDAPEVPGGLLWLHLAVRHGAAVTIEPSDTPEGSRAVVDPVLLRAGEDAMAEHVARGGEGEPWLGKVRREKVAAVPEGEEEAVEEVIEQRVESRAVIDLGQVRAVEQVMRRCVNFGGGPEELAELEAEMGVLPDFLREFLQVEGEPPRYWREHFVGQMCAWVIGLRVEG